MTVNLKPSELRGTIPAICSKSDVHRILLCAALADAPTEIKINSKSPLSVDILATAEVIRELGADVAVRAGSFVITPSGETVTEPHFDCKESGSTLRFLLPVAAARTVRPSFEGSGRLPERPIGELLDALKSGGITVSAPKLPFSFDGKLHAGTFTLPGNVSSQYITGLLLALPLLDGDSEIKLTTKLESAAYVDITLHALKRFGIKVEKLENGYFVPGNQQYTSPGVIEADGDWSNSAFFLVADAIGGGIEVTGLDNSSPQGDKAIVEIIEQYKGEDGSLKAQTVDLKEIPDMLPILAILAANSIGRSTFTGGERLRLKESDRIMSVHKMIESLGGKAEETEDGLIVYGKDEAPLCGGTVDSYNDHRIVMAAAIGAMYAGGETVINDAKAVNKSYPSFFEDLKVLGGAANVI